MAAQIAVAVQNAGLHEDLKLQEAEQKRAREAEGVAARRLSALYEISRSFAHSLSLEETLDAIATTVVELLEVDVAVIRVPDERGDVLDPAGARRRARSWNRRCSPSSRGPST